LPGLHTAPLRAAAARCASFDLVIAADSGLMHLAAASGVPLLGLFKATDPARYGPYGACQRALVTQHLAAADIARAALDLLPRA
jgi:ADP-heptose:LPS heptosyltransferase